VTARIPARVRAQVRRRARGRCEYCLIYEEDSYTGYQVDHIIARKHGGQTILSNLAFACVLCNRSKGSDVAAPDSSDRRDCSVVSSSPPTMAGTFYSSGWHDRPQCVRIHPQGNGRFGRQRLQTPARNPAHDMFDLGFWMFSRQANVLLLHSFDAGPNGFRGCGRHVV